MPSTYINLTAKDGGTFRGYLATPASGKGPGIVLCQEIFGVNAYVREVADSYAKDGYTVLAPDLFWRIEPNVDMGYSPQEWERAFDFFKKFNVDKGIEDIGVAGEALRKRPECSGKVGALGFCLGGKLAYLTACRVRVDASVCYYGVGIDQNLDESKNIKCPMVMHFADQDQFVPMESIEKVRAHFKSRPEIEIYVYHGVDHAFARSGGDHYDKAATLTAHARSMALFKKALG
ncbi:MAG TPA: dienelactone hydrolase family protein [Candidatus Cybelea sp.]|nr:dienelactone hydrolase family protein [Candidatus Cybelea sp.]